MDDSIGCAIWFAARASGERIDADDGVPTPGDLAQVSAVPLAAAAVAEAEAEAEAVVIAPVKAKSGGLGTRSDGAGGSATATTCSAAEQDAEYGAKYSAHHPLHARLAAAEETSEKLLAEIALLTSRGDRFESRAATALRNQGFKNQNQKQKQKQKQTQNSGNGRDCHAAAAAPPVPPRVAVAYRSPARVLLLGMGADEQMAGYGSPPPSPFTLIFFGYLEGTDGVLRPSPYTG